MWFRDRIFVGVSERSRSADRHRLYDSFAAKPCRFVLARCVPTTGIHPVPVALHAGRDAACGQICSD